MKILSKIKPINGADFKIADAKDIAIGDSDVEEAIKNLANGKLSAMNDFGTNNTQSATTLGNVIKRMPIFTHNGNLIGYIPIYDNIK